MSEKSILFDVHCHLHAEELFQQLEAVLSQARTKNIHVIGVSMDVDSSRQTIEIARRNPDVYAAVGLHPWNVETSTPVEAIAALLRARRKEIIALGEVGLDHTFVKDQKRWKAQELALEQLIDLAKTFKLPLITHGKGVESGLVEFLINAGAEEVVLHWFVGSEPAVTQALDAGYYFSVTPAISFQTQLRKVVELVPLNRLMLESDGPVRYKKLQGQPSVVPLVAAEIARIKQVSEEEVVKMATQTAKQFFRIS